MIAETYLSIRIFQFYQSFCNGILAKVTTVFRNMLRYESYLLAEAHFPTKISWLYGGNLHKEKRNIMMYQYKALPEDRPNNKEI